MMVKIEFFKSNKSLGSFDCNEGSNHEDRIEIANMNGITDFDRIVLDDGRVVMSKTKTEEFNDPGYIDTNDVIWYVKNNDNTIKNERYS